MTSACAGTGTATAMAMGMGMGTAMGTMVTRGITAGAREARQSEGPAEAVAALEGLEPEDATAER